MRAPAGAPNVLLILTDDVGFGASSAFGGPIPTPALDGLAAQGLRYTEFYVTAMCSPTRAALLTGRNHHAVGNGSISDVGVDEEGYTSIIPRSAATVGRVLRDNGYATGFFGKNHNTPTWESGPLGPYDRWPLGLGFDYFYGFNGAATDQFHPELIENLNPVRRDPRDASYFFERDVADHLIHWLDVQHSLQPDQPFMAYYAPAAMHGPQQAPAEWIARFRGRFDGGWDQMRAEIFARQKRMGIIPEKATLAPPPPGVPTWASLSPDQKRLAARMMEVAAAQLAYLDDQVARIIARLKATGQYDNTLIVFVQGDNGAAMHNLEGTLNVYSGFADVHTSAAENLSRIDSVGGPDTAGLYPVGWASAMNTPFPWGKTMASHLGGIRNGMVISWPRRIQDRGAIRRQFGHVVDIAPTLYEAIGITPPQQVDGTAQQPIDGTSLVYSFADARAPSRHREQYFEMLGNRSFYRDGWLASTVPAVAPWVFNTGDPNQLRWELYDLTHDYAQTRNVAAQHPDKLAELQAGFDAAARANHVYPLASNFISRLAPGLRPQAIPPRGEIVFRPGDTRYPIAAWANVTRNWQAASRLSVSSDHDSGPVFNAGTSFSGYGLQLERGVPVFDYNPTGRTQERRSLRGRAPLSVGAHEVTVTFVPMAQGVDMTLSVDGVEQARAHADRFDRVVNGYAMIGQAALGDTSGPQGCGCTIQSVTITIP
ncbi:arylsulfatase [Novosphingobium ovatum]|uniref:arylsulfatase n=1 Tax=Novosphingobium ovatum TaxID=1908523 RepID=UPI0029FEF980|nr:arylsulfatase [Novosphingobium ovatum]